LKIENQKLNFAFFLSSFLIVSLFCISIKYALAAISVTCNAGGPYTKNSAVNVVGNVTQSGSGTTSNVTVNVTSGATSYLTQSTTSGGDGGFFATFSSSQINTLDLGTYGVNVTATKNSDVYTCNTTLQILYLSQINCQTKTVYIGGNVLYADSGAQVSSGTITAGAVGAGIVNSTAFSNGQFSIYLTGCFFTGNLYTFSLVASDNYNRTSSTQINFIVI